MKRLPLQTCFIFLVLFLKNRFIEEDNPSEKVVIVEEELDGIHIDDIGNLEDLPRLVFINEECRNLKVVDDSGELMRNVNQKKKSDVLQAYRCPLCDKCCRQEYFFNNQVEYCELVR